MAERILLWTVTDPRGLSIALAADVWQATLQKHPEMQAFLEQVRLAVEHPDEIYFDPESSKRRISGAEIFLYYRLNLTVQDYANKLVVVVVKVVVEVNKQQGYIETAHLANRKKRRAVLEWNS